MVFPPLGLIAARTQPSKCPDLLDRLRVHNTGGIPGNYIQLSRPARRPTNLAIVATGMFFVVGSVEQLCKLGAVRLLAYRSLYFEEPMGGLVYGAGASLGFASLEHFFYVLN